MEQVPHKHQKESEVKELLDYDCETGQLTWRVRRSAFAKAGSKAGYLHKSGYVVVQIKGKSCYAHVIAWILHHNKLPNGEVDHINLIRSDNRIQNLRDLSTSENRKNTGMRKNNTSGCKGVVWKPNNKKWEARIGFNGSRIYLGLYNDLKSAAIAYREAEIKYFPRLYGG